MADRGFSSSQKCYDTATILEMGGEVVPNSDGSVSVYMLNNVGVLAPVVLNKTCCEALGAYVFDIDTQKCMSAAKSSTCSINDVFKVVLNPKGNAGALFYAEEDETCHLSIDFDYLFKVKCDTLSEMISGKQVGGVIAQINPGIELIPTKDSLSLAAQIKEQESLCASFSYQLEQINKELNLTPYSIECLYSQTQPVKTSTGLIEPYFTKTAFGGNASIAPFGLYFATSTGTFCLTDNGLSVWEKILGQIRYQAFLDGDPNSYSCTDVQNIVDQNANNLLKGEPELVYECIIPFGTRTNLILQQREISKNLEACRAILNELSVRSETISPVALPILNPVIEQVSNCSSPIDFFESFSVSMTVELVTSANTLQTVYEQPLFGPIGSGNLYNYLATAGTASGFYVCGDPNSSETSFNGCTPLLFEFEGTDVDNVTACQTVMTNILDGLFQESGLSGQTDGASIFQDSLSVSALTSNWLHFNTLITDPTVLSAITNQPIKISFKINSTCGNFCILVDEISLNKVCSKVKDTSLFITQPPSFNLERIRDNKKSWLANTTPVNRVFDMKNALGTNPIRQTNYDVNDERLVINSKEIDLDINIASGIETDVWCYIMDNPCITSATCTPREISCPAGYTLTADDLTCQKLEYTAVTTGLTVYTAVAGAKRCDSVVTYGENGGVFYPDLTTLNLPLNVSGGSLHTQSVVIDALNNIVPIEATVLNSVWGNGPGTCGVYPCDSSCPEYYNRINQIGLWTSPNAPDNEWVGWAFCVNIPTTGVYTIGIAADDACRVKVNGDMTFSFDAAGWNFLAFRMFPITLSTGLNIIEMEIANFGGGSATLAAEIYSASTSVISGITSESALTPYIVFSTGDYIGQEWQIGEDSGFSCPSGYALNTCVDPYTCVKITKVDAEVTGDCCDPCTPYSASCGNKSFQDDECFLFQDAEVYEFMDGDYTLYPQTTLNGSYCCGDEIDFDKLLTQPLSAVTTLEDFQYFLTSELIDAKNRQTISGYPTLKALYERYINSTQYCNTKSSAFNYMTMDQFAGLIDSYWVDIVEQVIPATTIWGSVKIYSNTLFDQQKYKYKAYTSLLCGNPYSGKTILSPISGTTGQCTGVEVITTNVILNNQPNVRMKQVTSVCDSLCIAQMNMGSEFIGTVTIDGPSNTGDPCGSSNFIGENPLSITLDYTMTSVTASVAGAVGNVTYDWSNGGTGDTVYNLASGQYTLTVSDEGCNSTTVSFTVPELVACWYNLPDDPLWVSGNTEGTFTPTVDNPGVYFGLASFILNGNEQLTSSPSTLVNTDNLNWVPCINYIGNTYTNFVDFLNQVFVDLGLPHYKAQISQNKIVANAMGDPMSGFYIIRPAGDTFTLQVTETLNFDHIYTESSATDSGGGGATYNIADCTGNNVVDGVVIE